MRVLVCGGRDYGRVPADTPDELWPDAMVRAKHQRGVMKATLAQARGRGMSLLIHGGARGADSFAGEWAQWNDMPVEVYRADWANHGKAAGPIRNRVMLTNSSPQLVIAFPGGAGTQDMVRIATAAGVPVERIAA